MTIDKVIVLIFSISGIIFTYWFFLMKKDKEVSVSDTVDIMVSGGYSPNVIVIPVRKKTTITFIRKDPSTCLEEVILSDFKIRKYLPLHEKVSIDITPIKKGTFNFSCGMGMFHGKILVK